MGAEGCHLVVHTVEREAASVRRPQALQLCSANVHLVLRVLVGHAFK